MTTTLTKTNGAKPGQELAPIDKSLAAEASSAHSRINIPINLENWKALSPEVSVELLWFHQWVMDNNVGYKEAEEALGYDKTTIYRVLKGFYEGAYDNVVKAIRSFKKLQEQRASIQSNEFAENSLTKMIFAGLDYALANNTITTIIGESREGKTITGEEWCLRNNHGRSAMITAPVIGGAAALTRRIADKCGINKNKSTTDILDSIYRAFNKNRILIVDEAHRLMPSNLRTVNPVGLELLRDIHDQTGCALALLATQRFSNHLKKGVYQYEQLVGRIGMPVRLPAKIKRGDVLPIVKQYVKTPSAAVLDQMERIANEPGRLGIMVETLKVASRIASKAHTTLNESHVDKAIAIRAQMSGGEEK